MLIQIEKLKGLIRENHLRLKLIPESIWSDKSHPDKWSKKEILGHLVDSAQNNLRRLIITQKRANAKIIYDQDFWVKSQNYQHRETDEILALWHLLNEQLIHTFIKLPPDKYHLTTDIGRVQREYVNFPELLDMYIEHLQHHLRQILEET